MTYRVRSQTMMHGEAISLGATYTVQVDRNHHYLTIPLASLTTSKNHY